MSGVYVSWPKPIFTTIVKTNKHFRTNFHCAMTYVHYEVSANNLKKELIQYLKTLDAKHPFIERVKDIDENRFMTIGKYAYILNQGADVPDDILPNLLPSLEKLINEEEAKVAKEVIKIQGNGNKEIPALPERNTITIQDRLLSKAREVAGEMEGWIDDFCADKKSTVKSVDEFVSLYKANDLKAPHMRHLQSIFGRRSEEVAEALSGNDKDLLESYSNFTKPELKKFDLFHKNLFKACDMLQEVAKVERTPRVKKPVSLDKAVAKLKYKKDDNTLGIVSMNPVHIIGCKEMWVYNTKTRKLTQYKAVDERGLTVKGTALLNYSTESMEKTVRKPAETLADFKKASKVKLRTFLKELSTLDVQPNGKLNEHHIILRIDK